MASNWYILTIAENNEIPFNPNADLPETVDYIRGQKELSHTGYLHWQIVVHLSSRRRSGHVRELYPGAHVEATRSAAALEYVWKEDTRVDGTQFENGTLPINRASKTDWERVWTDAKAGQFEAIPADIRLRSYQSLRRISSDYAVPQPIERQVVVYWGATGTGKSRRAWDEAGFTAYPKDPNTKFWDGYRQHDNVVIDEFRGRVDISHLLRWFDRYPVIVEIKGAATILAASKIWITSNLDPSDWYPDCDPETRAALRRRFTVTHFHEDL